MRMRVVVSGPEGALAIAGESFGLPGFKVKGEHASQVVGVPIGALPMSIPEIWESINSRELVHKLTSELEQRLKDAGATQLVSTENIADWLREGYATDLPELPDVAISDDVVYGLH